MLSPWSLVSELDDGDSTRTGPSTGLTLASRRDHLAENVQSRAETGFCREPKWQEIPNLALDKSSESRAPSNPR